MAPTIQYRVAPSMRCQCAPSKVFADLTDAQRYAREAVAQFRVSYAIWAVRDGRPQRVTQENQR